MWKRWTKGTRTDRVKKRDELYVRCDVFAGSNISEREIGNRLVIEIRAHRVRTREESSRGSFFPQNPSICPSL